MNCPKCGHVVVDMVGLLCHYNDTHRDTTAASYNLVVEAREANIKTDEQATAEQPSDDPAEQRQPILASSSDPVGV